MTPARFSRWKQALSFLSAAVSLRVLIMLLQRATAIKSQIGGTFAYVLGWLSGAISITLLTVLAVTISAKINHRKRKSQC